MVIMTYFIVNFEDTKLQKVFAFFLAKWMLS